MSHCKQWEFDFLKSFYNLNYWLWLGLLNIHWIKVVTVDMLVLFLILEEMFSAFHHYDVRCKSIIYGLYYIEVYSPYNHFLEGFYHKLVLNFVKSFFCIYWGDHVVFILQLVILYYTDCSYILKNPCIPGINLTWTCYMILLMYCWIWFASILLRVFASMFTRTLTPVGEPLWYNSVIRFFFQSVGRSSTNHCESTHPIILLWFRLCFWM